MNVWRTHVGSERAHARFKSCIRCTLQQVNARLSRLLRAGTHAETIRFNRRHLISSVPEWKLVVDEVHPRCLLVRTESAEVFAKEVEVHRLPNRIRPPLFLLHILSKMIPIDVEPSSLVVLTGQPSAVDLDRAHLLRLMTGSLRWLASPCRSIVRRERVRQYI